MTACRCESCAPASPSPTYTMAHRLACEARFALAMLLEQRRAYLAEVLARRGPAGQDTLKAAIPDAWEHPRSPRP